MTDSLCPYTLDSDKEKAKNKQNPPKNKRKSNRGGIPPFRAGKPAMNNDNIVKLRALNTVERMCACYNYM